MSGSILAAVTGPSRSWWRSCCSPGLVRGGLWADTHPGWKQKNVPPKYEVTGGSFEAVDGGRQVMPRPGGRPIPTQEDRDRAGHFGYVPPQQEPSAG